MRELIIDGVRIADDTDAYVIAEIGHNHQGSLEKAKELIRSAAACGVHAVKLQKRDVRSLFTRAFYERPYDHENSFGEPYGAHREALELDAEAFRSLIAFSTGLGVTFFATAFDVPSADVLASLGVPAFKIASADLTNLPLLRHVAAFERPVVMSTGGATMDDVDRAVQTTGAVHGEIALLQCTAAYPCAFEEMNLRVVETYRERFPELVVGLSAHDNGIAMPLVAYTLGARIVEKHFTLNRAWKGTDHAFSLEPNGLRRLVRDLERARHALGDGRKRRYESEKVPLHKMAKGLVAARDLPVGRVLSEADLAIKSPADGLSPAVLDDVVGRVLARPLTADAPLVESALRAKRRPAGADPGIQASAS